jgi:hypothetical protein
MPACCGHLNVHCVSAATKISQEVLEVEHGSKVLLFFSKK